MKEERLTDEVVEVRATKRQRLMTEYMVDQPLIEEEEDQTGEIEGLKDRILEESMAKKGARAMERSTRNKNKARDKYWKYTNLYKHLATIGDKGMVKAWGKANRVMENWMGPERLQVVPEEDETQDEPKEEQLSTPPDDDKPKVTDEEIGEPETTQGPPVGQVRKITDYFNKMGGQITPKAPKKALKDPKTPGTREPQGRKNLLEQEELANLTRKKENRRLMSPKGLG